MFKIIKKIFIFLALIVFVLLISIFIYFFAGSVKISDKINWGVDFSQMQAENLKLDWKETYLALIKDLGAKNIKLHTQWDWVEGKKDNYYFKDIDWQLKQAENNDVNIIYVLGMKTGRWPECHIPDWAANLSETEQQSALLDYISTVVERYKDSKIIVNWQVENEPLLEFGECPSWYYNNDEFLKKEVALVKSLDPSRQIIISDSGELSWWTDASKIGDILGTTMYRKAWINISSFGFSFKNPGFYASYPIPPVFYYRKAQLINFLFGKKVICIELQAEPWASEPFYDVSLEEQFKTMDLARFKENVEYAKKTGLDTFYFWGPEWWYWMKTVKNQPDIWNEAKNLFNN
jgi:hypothetical protein